MDGNADDVRFEFEFKTEIRGIVRQLDLFLSYVALPPITSLRGAGSEGLGLRQTYTVTMVRGESTQSDRQRSGCCALQCGSAHDA